MVYLRSGNYTAGEAKMEFPYRLPPQQPNNIRFFYPMRVGEVNSPEETPYPYLAIIGSTACVGEGKTLEAAGDDGAWKLDAQLEGACSGEKAFHFKGPLFDMQERLAQVGIHFIEKPTEGEVVVEAKEGKVILLGWRIHGYDTWKLWTEPVFEKLH